VESRAVPEMTEESAAEATRAGGGGGRSTVMEEVESAQWRRGGEGDSYPTSVGRARFRVKNRLDRVRKPLVAGFQIDPRNVLWKISAWP